MRSGRKKILGILFLLFLALPQIAFGSLEGVMSIREILISLLKWLLNIIGILALISFAVSGAQYFFSSGDEKVAEGAKKTMIFSIIGVVVALSGLILARSIETILR